VAYVSPGSSGDSEDISSLDRRLETATHFFIEVITKKDIGYVSIVSNFELFANNSLKVTHAHGPFVRIGPTLTLLQRKKG
jgi:hypothetical protein